MTFREILVAVTGEEHDATALATAFLAAKPFGAHVEVLFAKPDPYDAVPYLKYTLPPRATQELVDTIEAAVNRAAESARTAMTQAAARHGVVVGAASAAEDGVRATWRECAGRLDVRLASDARFCDLVVFPPIAGKSPELLEAFHRTLSGITRPLILSPLTPPRHLGRKIAVGWDGSQNAARAVHAALPLLARAAEVEIVCVGQTPTGPADFHRLEAYLKAHGITCRQALLSPQNSPVGRLLLDRAQMGGSDLLVVGGYGHNRWLETVFGGVTEHIVSHPGIAVFMTH